MCATVEEVVDEELPLQPVLKSLKKADEATVDLSDLCLLMEHEETEVVAPEPIEDECPTFEAVDVSHAAVELGHDEHEDAGVAGCRTTVEDVISVEDAPVEDVTVEDATAVDDVTDMLGEDEIPLPQPVSLVREKTVKRNARALSEIWGCEGIGPVIWKGF
ncbi:hypothetical protein E4U60_000145 [Claviceps pazoutovae]|uniref:Uncharacterized protein n=1 Tax=Claviceps pazoutovae TaxID=1649127 RepID=A0A9P7SBA1_9HYPO|nr:hypothetical protein E4U60_000145 [Claviceps pazoutovae]